MVTKKSAEIGQVVQPGQPLLAVVPLKEVWVTANFKETQLEDIRLGQPAEIRVDAYGGVVFKAHVDSISAATGARFSLLPAENASGNFVKGSAAHSGEARCWMAPPIRSMCCARECLR